MSNTDKDRPFWVQNLEAGYIEHDHRSGVCIVSNDQRDRWPAWRSHYKHCKKRVVVEFNCTKSEPYQKNRYSPSVCWVFTRVCECPIPDAWKREDHGCTGRLRRRNCVGHTRVEYDESIECACDTKPEHATCFPEWVYGRSFYSGGVPSWYVGVVYHRPERRRERDSLSQFAREYSTYGDIEDDDFNNRQARNGARWTWW